MVIVAGHLLVAPDAREAYLAGCVTVITQARAAPGCLDFAIGADLTDPGRINIFERWDSQESVEVFRGSGTSAEQNAEIAGAVVSEYDIAGTRPLT
ncbi:putative quinol monooxygenase [Nocardia flavorosea]|uniref:Antibiotic biosynthesis monooxygenase n=1 Tax=Nocardia flavorosea TaxID=53429 RepID=A0A846YSX0_9NOCA|nr:antibiotic biosynthesis monooxygenase family protein [Nocardia flavorosea]NKY60574.1 antibiotic biosynthesis monooxygenase [Nocardia flavorosea]